MKSSRWKMARHFGIEMTVSQAIRLLEQRPPLRGEQGESGTPPQENTSNSQ